MSIQKISVTTDNLIDHFDVLSCFLHGATTLHAVACDGLAKNMSGSIGQMTNEFWNDDFITAFFLLRHALEVAIKALVKEVKGLDVNGHNIKKIWEENIPNHNSVLPDEINKAFNVLDKYHLLKDAQLFRYYTDKSGVKLKDLPPLENEDFDALSGAAWAIRQLILEQVHIKKGLPV